MDPTTVESSHTRVWRSGSARHSQCRSTGPIPVTRSAEERRAERAAFLVVSLGRSHAQTEYLDPADASRAVERALPRQLFGRAPTRQNEVHWPDVRGSIPADQPVDLNSPELEPVAGSMTFDDEPDRIVSRVRDLMMASDADRERPELRAERCTDRRGISRVNAAAKWRSPASTSLSSRHCSAPSGVPGRARKMLAGSAVHAGEGEGTAVHAGEAEGTAATPVAPAAEHADVTATKKAARIRMQHLPPSPHAGSTRSNERAIGRGRRRPPGR